MSYQLPPDWYLTTLAVLPKISGGISIVCISALLYDITFGNNTIIPHHKQQHQHKHKQRQPTTQRRTRRKLDSVYQRLIFAIGITGIISGFGLFLSTWPIPSSSWERWASGNETTCKVQGFLVQYSSAVPLNFLALSIYYVLTVRYSWREERLKRWEPAFLLVPVLWGLGTSTACLMLDLFHSAVLWCWIANPPPGYSDRDVNDIDRYRMVFYYIPLWTSMALVCFSCLLVFGHVRRITLSADRHTKRSLRNNLSSNTTVLLQPSPDGSGITNCKSRVDSPVLSQSASAPAVAVTAASVSASAPSVLRQNNNMSIPSHTDPNGNVDDEDGGGGDDDGGDEDDVLYGDQGFSDLSSRSDVPPNKVEGSSPLNDTGVVTGEATTVVNDDEENQNYRRNRDLTASTIATTTTDKTSSSLSSSLTSSLPPPSQRYDVEQQRSQLLLSSTFVKRRRDVAYQSLRFCLSFIVTFLPISIIRVLQMVNPGDPIPGWLFIWAAFQSPLFLNTIFVYYYPYVRNRWKRRLWRKSTPLR